MGKSRCAVRSLIVAIVALNATLASAMSLDDGRYYFRYKGHGTGDLAVNEPIDNSNKDITAFYIGGLSVPFSEELPMKPQWQNDNWVIDGGALPPGLSFDASKRRFFGTPTSIGIRKVTLTGFDREGNPVASASAEFNIVNVPETNSSVELYGHTNKFFNKSLDLPTGVVVHQWREFYAPPPGVKYNGRYVDGTPTKPGTYPVLNVGYDYNGEAIFAYVGKMIVEDGPTFDLAKDDIRQVAHIPGICEYGFECAYWVNDGLPQVKHAITDPSNVTYTYELASGEEIPQGMSWTRQFPPSKAYFTNGRVFDFYDQATVRIKAVDVDGTAGYSNWFKIGSGGPKELCKPINGREEIELSGVVGHDFLSGGYRIAAGVNVSGGVFKLVDGKLPTGLSLDNSSGTISGVPQAEEIQDGISIEVTYPDNAEFEPVTCGPYKIDVGPDQFDLKLVTEMPIGFHVDDTINVKFAATGALLEGYDVEVVREKSRLPDGVSFSKTGEMEWSLTGQPKEEGAFDVFLTLVNGDGRRKALSVPFIIAGPLTIADISGSEIELPQFESATITDPLTSFVVGNQVGGAKINLDSNFEGVSINNSLLVGGTTKMPGRYGPYVATVTDDVGAQASTKPFYFKVVPRKGLEGDTSAVNLIANKRVIVTPFDVKQEPLAGQVYGLHYSISPSTLPQGLIFDSSSGIIDGVPVTVGSYPGYKVVATEVGAPGGATITSETFSIEVGEPAAIGNLKMPKLQGNKNGLFITSDDPKPALDKASNNIVGSLSDIKFISASPMVAGLSLNTTTGRIEGVPTEEFKGDVLVAIEDAAGRTGTLELPVEVYPYPQLSAPAYFDIPRLSAAEDFGVAVVPNSGFYAGQQFRIAPTSQQSLPNGMVIEASTGKIRGSSSLPVGTTRSVVIRAVSTANGIVVDLPVVFKIVEQLPMVLDIPPADVAIFKMVEATHDVSVSPSKSMADYLSGSFARPVNWSLGNAPDWLGINERTGLLFARANPPRAGDWLVEVRATDAENKSVKASAKVKVTLDGYVTSQTGGTKLVLRQGETFRLPEQILSNVLPPYSFAQDLTSVEDYQFNSLTAETWGRFDSWGARSWGLRVADRDGRGFASTLMFGANVRPPLGFPSNALPVSVSTVQYDPAKAVSLVFPRASNEIDDVSYVIDGAMPGTLYYKTKDKQGRAVYSHYPASGGVATVVQSANETEDATEARLAPDRLVFDTTAMSLSGVTSKVGSYPFYLAAHDDHEERGYTAKPSDTTRATYNNAEFGPFEIKVASKPQLQLVASTGIPRYVVVNNQDAQMKVTAKNVGYGIQNWLVTGAASLPPGVTHQVLADGVLFTGKPTLLGDFPGVKVQATDKLGQTTSLDISFKVIPSPDAIILNVSDISTKVGLPVRMEQPYATDVLSTENTYGNLYFATKNGEAHGVKIDAATGAFNYTATKVGDYTFSLSVTDDTDRITSHSVVVHVLPNLRLLVPSVLYFEQGVATTKSFAVDYAIGRVTYEKGAGAWPSGLSVDPSTGSIKGATTAVVGDYGRLTVIGRDESGDVQSSNEFTINVEPIRAKPVIANVSGKMIIGTVGVAVTPVFPTVTDSVVGKPWIYEGTVYTINHDLTPYGLSFDRATGKISGTPTKPVIFDDTIITVKSERGDESSTKPFFFGVAPDGPITVAEGLPEFYMVRAGQSLDISHPFIGAFGEVKYAIVSGGNAWTWSAVDADGKVAVKPPQGIADQTSELALRVTDVFGRSANVKYSFKFLANLSVQSVNPNGHNRVDTGQNVVDLKIVNVTGLAGIAQYSADNLPAGLRIDPVTGLISGTVVETGSKIKQVVVTVKDKFDNAAATGTVSIALLDASSGSRYWRLSATFANGTNRGGGYMSEVMFINLIGQNDGPGGSVVPTKGSWSAVQPLLNGFVYYDEVYATANRGDELQLTFDFQNRKVDPKQIDIAGANDCWCRDQLWFQATSFKVEKSNDGLVWFEVPFVVQDAFGYNARTTTFMLQ